MGLIQLVERGATKILPAFWNDIRSALIGDFVGRDVNGNPAAGKNLGTATYPWGAGYFNQAIIGGVAFDESVIEGSPYQIVSGKVRSGSNQPIFLRPAGSSLSYSLFATTTNLILTINGAAATWTADKTGIPATAAPSSTNTCLVNDNTAAGQAATRTWGEYGSGSPYYAITVDNMGASVSARVGTYQAFKVGTEYFIAFIESTTSLTRAFRGYFFNSSDAPLKRVTLTDNDTITLMNLGYVFADEDGNTVDTIFTGAGVNNTPTYSHAEPSSPASGDYWYDQGEQLWKRYNGSSWATTPRTLVGLVVADSSNCVAARCFDFFGVYREDNTIEIERISNTVVKGQGLFSRVNVNGQRVQFFTSRPTWDTASHLAASTERYNASVTASVTEYFYVTDDGNTKISDIEPYWRPDLLGYYHPYNPWRCVGFIVPDGSANFGSGGAVNKEKTLARSRVSSSSSGSAGGAMSSGTPADVTGLTCTITTRGFPVRLWLQHDGSGNRASVNTSANVGQSAAARLYFMRDSTTICIVQWQGVTTHILTPGCFEHLDDNNGAGLPPGTYTYKVQISHHSGGGGQTSIDYSKLYVEEELT